MAVTRDITGADRVIAAYNAVLAIVWASAGASTSAALPAAAAHGAAAMLPWLVAGRVRRGAMSIGRSGGASSLVRLGHGLRTLYPLIAVVVFWIELDPLIRSLGRPPIDTWVLEMDELIFGTHLHAVWQPHMSNALLGELMHLSYFAYYPLIFLPPMIAFVRGRDEAARDMAFRLILSYTCCYLLYIAMPAYGPRFASGGFDPAMGGAMRAVVEWAHGLGDSIGTAFPSSHVAGAVTIAVLGWRWFGRTAAWLLTVQAGGVVLSTVYTQNHYAIDSLAGLAVTLVLQLAVVPIILGLGRTTSEPRAEPVFPNFERLLDTSRGMSAFSGMRGPHTAGS